MKTIIRSTLLFIVLFANTHLVDAQYISYFISGHVYASYDSLPVYNHQVEIAIDTAAGGIGPYYKSLLTNQIGYFADTIMMPVWVSQFIVQISTLDSCLGTNIHEYRPLDTTNTSTGVDFYICMMNNDCEALYSFSPIPSEPFSIYFTDQSSGLIDTWAWDFGDGTASSQQNPVHTFNSPGTYEVCLTVSNTDSIYYCLDEYCATIQIQDTIQCIAAFDFVLDSNSSTPNKYQFFDISTGDPDFWYWDFGDGSSSTQQNPVHIFQQEGNYSACLIIGQNAIGGCTDTTCKQIATPQYLNFGGFAYTGDHPINNPFPTGDTGTAYLYKVYPNKQIVAIDTNVFADYGYYYFSNKLPGDYIVKIALTQNSYNYKNYLPTYFEDQYRWQQAQNIPLGDTNAYNRHIYLHPIPGAEAGFGTISGQIIHEFGTPFDFPYRLSSTEIILADQDDHAQDFTYSDETGKFSFRNIAYGTYKLIADHIGKYALPVLVEVSAITPVVDTVLIKLFDYNVTGMNELPGIIPLEAGNIYPNPVMGELNLEIQSLNNIMVSISIMDIHGRKIIAHSKYLSSGENRIQIPVADLPRGIYLLMIRTSKDLYNISRKFIK